MHVMEDGAKEIRARSMVAAVRYLVVAALLAALCVEGYYIIVFRATIKKQTEDLRNISVQLQLLKSEHETLRQEVSSAGKYAGEKDDGNTGQR